MKLDKVKEVVPIPQYAQAKEEIVPGQEGQVIRSEPIYNNPNLPRQKKVISNGEQRIINRALDVVHDKIITAHQNGENPEVIRNKFGLERHTIERLLESANPEHLAKYKRKASISKLAISNLLDEVIVSRVEECPETIKFSELAIASGIMAQRSIELGREGDVGILPDFNKITEWDKVKAEPKPDAPVLDNVVDV